MIEAYGFGGHEYIVGQPYRFEDLPWSGRRDARAQAEDIEVHRGVDYRDATYRLTIVPNEDLVNSLEDRFGEEELARKLRMNTIHALSRKIERDGLQQPPVVDEGIDRALALVLLGWDMPYFTVDESIEWPVEEMRIPTLEGRRRAISRTS